jgi:hypothetical protein
VDFEVGGEKLEPDDSPMSDLKEPETGAVQVLHRDMSTQSQIGMLLAVSNTMIGFIRMIDKAEENRDLEPEQCEASIAAENTLIKACDRIDSILQDDNRWGLEFQTRLEKLFEKNTEIARGVAEKQTALIEETREKERVQREAILQNQKPHVLFRPTLFPMPDHTWVAFLGDPANLQSGVMGTGPSPGAALESFDLAFSGRLTQEQEQKIQSIQNEHQALEQDRNQPTGEIDQGGEDGARGSGTPGA